MISEYVTAIVSRGLEFFMGRMGNDQTFILEHYLLQ